MGAIGPAGQTIDGTLVQNRCVSSPENYHSLFLWSCAVFKCIIISSIYFVI